MRGHSAPFLVALLVLGAVPTAGAEPPRRLRLDISDHDDGGLTVTFDGAWVAGLAAALAVVDLDCDVTTDPDLGALLRHLEREGEGSRAEVREDGERLVARRRRGHLELSVVDRRGERAEDVTLRDALGAVRAGGLRVLVSGEDGSLRVSLD
jgi:hypothetical protein